MTDLMKTWEGLLPNNSTTPPPFFTPRRVPDSPRPLELIFFIGICHIFRLIAFEDIQKPCWPRSRSTMGSHSGTYTSPPQRAVFKGLLFDFDGTLGFESPLFITCKTFPISTTHTQTQCEVKCPLLPTLLKPFQGTNSTISRDSTDAVVKHWHL